MSLKERLTSDLQDAMRSREQERLDVLRFLLAEIHNAEIEAKHGGSIEFKDEDVIKVLQSEAKKRRESIALFESSGRTDLVEEETKQLGIITSYLPKELNPEEVKVIATRLKNEGIGTFPELMKAVMAETKGRVDGKVVSVIVKELTDGQ
ncbi:MAG: GatB/YqeY domain-containing protein [Anaplasmataceae bacterium]|nr:GatB/YqeY domain-containing protein [Anaplasmataceae bacterium]